MGLSKQSKINVPQRLARFVIIGYTEFKFVILTFLDIEQFTCKHRPLQEVDDQMLTALQTSILISA